jgi:hypothetical protein
MHIILLQRLECLFAFNSRVGRTNLYANVIKIEVT